MDVKQLEYFRAIVDAGTISGAARVLHMTQPPLSYQGKMLQDQSDSRRRTSGAAFLARHQKDYINGSRKNTV